MIAESGFFCIVRVTVGEERKECGRPRDKRTDCCCKAHWRLVPAKMRRAFVEAGKLRSRRERERKTELALVDILEFLYELKIQLPPVERLQVAGELLRGAPVGRLVQLDEVPTVSKDTKLIIPGR